MTTYELYPCYDNLIVTCTATKTISGGPNYRHYKGEPSAWKNALALMTLDTYAIPAYNLYTGPVWRHNQKLFKYVKNIYVASAGYGLIPITKRVKPYNATFSGNWPDSIRPKSTAQTWWETISCTPFISVLREGTTLIVATKGYIYAMEPELLDTQQIQNKPNVLHIVTCGYVGPLTVRNVSLKEFGPPCIGLVQRAAYKLLEEANGTPQKTSTCGRTFFTK